MPTKLVRHFVCDDCGASATVEGGDANAPSGWPGNHPETEGWRRGRSARGVSTFDGPVYCPPCVARQDAEDAPLRAWQALWSAESRRRYDEARAVLARWEAANPKPELGEAPDAD